MKKYEKPQIVNLNFIDVGYGKCKSGSSEGGKCETGGFAQSGCTGGSSVAGTCKKGAGGAK